MRVCVCRLRPTAQMVPQSISSMHGPAANHRYANLSLLPEPSLSPERAPKSNTSLLPKLPRLRRARTTVTRLPLDNLQRAFHPGHLTSGDRAAVHHRLERCILHQHPGVDKSQARCIRRRVVAANCCTGGPRDGWSSRRLSRGLVPKNGLDLHSWFNCTHSSKWR